MSSTEYGEYRQRHPFAWVLIGVALLAVAGVGAVQGWLPGFAGEEPVVACADCAVVESVRTVETPLASDPLADAAASPEETPAMDGAAEPMAQVSYSYEITVRYEDGSRGVFNHMDPPPFAAGDKVRVVDGVMLVAG